LATKIPQIAPTPAQDGPFEFTVVFRNKRKSILSHRGDTQTFRHLVRSMPPRGVHPSNLECQTNGCFWAPDAQVIKSLRLMPIESRVVYFVERTW